MTDGAVKTEFLNVDLDIYSRLNLEPLVAALGQRVCVLHVGREGQLFSAHLELSRQLKSADATIRRFAVLIRCLSRAARRLWEGAERRDFNIGVQAAATPHAYEVQLAARTIQTVSSLKARIVVTVYGTALATRAR